MKKTLIAMVLVLVGLCGSAYAKPLIYEFTWDIQGMDHSALVCLDGDEGTVRVVVYNENGREYKIVNQHAEVSVKDDGVIIYCYNPVNLRTGRQDSNYIADNFLIHESGQVYVVDDGGNTARINAYEVGNSDYSRMVRKYHLD